MLIDGRSIEEIMTAMVALVKSTHNGYQQLIIVGVCILVLLFISKKDRTRVCLPVLLIAILLFIPQLYVYLYEATSYKRFFWLLPDGILVAYVSVLIISKIQINWIKAIVAFAIGTLLIVSGQSIYSKDVGFFQQAENLQQVDSSTKELVDMIIALDSEPTCVFPPSTSVMVRIYNAEIIQGYGRNTYGYNGPIDPVLKKVSNNLNIDTPDTDFVFSVAKNKGIKFVVAYNYTDIDEQICAKYGYSLCRNVANYNIYYNPDPSDGGEEWIITQYGEDSGKNTLYTIEDCDDNLVIIDGGYIWNVDAIKAILRDHDYHVSAWIITTLSDAHSGAAFELLKEYSDLLTIDNIYIQAYSDEMLDVVYLHQMDWEIAELENSAAMVNLINSFDNVTYVCAGEDYDVLGLKMHVYHVWDDAVESIGSREASNSSLVFSLSGKEDSILFMSYVTRQIQDDVMAAIGDQQFSYVTANDHGEWVFDYWCFDMLNPIGVFLDDESDRLLPDGNAYKFFYYLLEKDYNTYTFATVPNRISFR